MISGVIMALGTTMNLGIIMTLWITFKMQKQPTFIKKEIKKNKEIL